MALHARIIDSPPEGVPKAGAGDTVAPTVLLHGFTGSTESWGEGVLQGLTKVGPVVAIDLPGHGRTLEEEPVERSRPLKFEGVVDRLASDVRTLGFEVANWVGYSMGGRLALAIAARHPKQVKRVVLESASPGLESAGDRARRRRQDEGLARRLEVEGLEPFVTEWMEMPIFRSQESLPSSVLKDARSRRLRNDPRALAAVLRGLGTGGQPSYWETLATIEAPVLLLTGSLDRKFEALADRMHQRIPESRRASIPNVGHAVHLESPRRWIDVVTEFLSD